MNDITAFLGIFEGRLNKIKKKIEKLLKEDKKDRDKKYLKDLLKEAKELKKIVKRKPKHFCPCCGYDLGQEKQNFPLEPS